MKLGFMELLDTSGLPEESKKFFETMDEKMGTARFIRAEICGKYRAGNLPRHSLLCHEDAALLLHRHAYPRRTGNRSRPSHVS